LGGGVWVGDEATSNDGKKVVSSFRVLVLILWLLWNIHARNDSTGIRITIRITCTSYFSFSSLIFSGYNERKDDFYNTIGFLYQVKKKS
jgi:hypothetical protein